MKRLIIVFILVSQSNYVVFTLEDSVPENVNMTANVGVSTLFPINKDMNVGENIAGIICVLIYFIWLWLSF
jgi:hypothetical protein